MKDRIHYKFWNLLTFVHKKTIKSKTNKGTLKS